MAKITKKNLNTSPDETRAFDKGKVDLGNLGDITIGKAEFDPGWNWDKFVKPIAKTDSCQGPHTQYVISGRMKVVMDDGTEEEFGPGDVGTIPPGHNAWIVGQEKFVAIDFTGDEDLREVLV